MCGIQLTGEQDRVVYFSVFNCRTIIFCPGSPMAKFGRYENHRGWPQGQKNPHGRPHSSLPDLTKLIRSLTFMHFLSRTEMWPGPTSTGPVADSSTENTGLLSCTVWQFISLIGLLTATEKQVHIGLAL